MELSDALARRRMVRRYDPDAAVPEADLEAVLAAALRAPSAGFTQGVSLLVLTTPDERDRFWSLTADGPSRWLDGMRTAPVLVLVLTSRDAYVERYAEPDKASAGRAVGDPWAAPYWYVDAGMAAMAMLLTAVDRGLGACFFGVPPHRVEAVRAAYGVPAEQLSVGVVSLGHLPPDGDKVLRGSPSRRGRRPPDELIHRGAW